MSVSPRGRVAPRRQAGGRQRATVGRIFLGFLLAAFFGGSLVAGASVLDQTSTMVAGWTSGQPLGLPAPVETGPAWKGTDRVNILLMGIDRRDDEAEELSRTDSMLVLTIDPKTKTAGIVSLPRDLLVPIPLTKGTVEDRVNTTWVYAANSKYPGGGPALAKKTVSNALGVPIHYAAWIDFTGFTKVVDRLGGLTIDVPAPLKDNEYPTETYGIQRIYFAPGLQHFDGARALIYARSRHQDSDVYRASRQQQVLLAARQQFLTLDLLPKLPSLIGEFRTTIKSDFGVNDILALARLGKDIDVRNVTIRTVPSVPSTTSTGADVLIIDKRGLAKTVAEVFPQSGVVEEPPASVEVLNAAGTPLLATSWANVFTQRGLTVARYDTAEESGRGQTDIYAPAANRRTAEKIASILGVPNDRIHDRPPSGPAEIRVILGRETKLPVVSP